MLITIFERRNEIKPDNKRQKIRELYFEIKLFPWDFSAGELLIKEAGGFICSLENEISHQKKQAIIAANSEENLYKLKEIINLYFTKNLE